MAIQHGAYNEPVNLEEYFAILEKDPEHGYEYFDGRIYMMTGGSPDHSILGSNTNGILRELLRGHGCIVYNQDTSLMEQPNE
jgi:Uma2 family endonuclease